MFLNYLQWRYHQWREKRFDKIHGIDTAYSNQNYFLSAKSDNKKFAVAYEPIHQHILREMLQKLPEDLSEFTFVDLGSGKGRALFMAAKYKFKGIVGVEFSRNLHEIAENNVKNYIKATGDEDRFSLHLLDVTEFDLPKSNLVLFLYNPFFGEVMDDLIKKIDDFINTQPHDIWVLYRNPQCADLFEKSSCLKLKIDNSSYHIYAKSND